MARLQFADVSDGFQIWRAAADILNKQSMTADKGWPSSLGVGQGASNSSLYKLDVLSKGRGSLGHGKILWKVVSNRQWI
jgi:hypothetical protein